MARLPPAAVNGRKTPDDPLHERRGDLIGRNAILFAVTLLAAIAVVALVLIAYRPSDLTARLSPSASASASVRISVRPSSAPSGSPTARPSTPLPSSSIAPTTSPSPAQPSVGVRYALAGPAGPIGTVEVSAPISRQRVNGRAAPEGTGWIVIRVRYEATEPISYRASDWQLEDDGGSRNTRHDIDSTPPLGAGQLGAGEVATGTVTFAVPEGRDITAVVLTDGAQDVVIFRVP